MKNFVQRGENITVTAPAAVASGDPVLIGALFGVANCDAASGAPLVISTTGVFVLPKAMTDAVTVGAAVYFDAAEAEVTTDDAEGANPMVGHAVSAAGNPSATVAVRLSV